MQPSLLLNTIVITTIDFFFKFLSIAIMLRVFMSWLSPRQDHALGRFIYGVTEPILAIFRLLPLRIGMMDFTPIAALLTIQYLNPVAVETVKKVALWIGM